MNKNYKYFLCLAASLIALSGCTTITPNQGIADAQARLSADYNDKKIAERGQGDLANAKNALSLAQTEWSKGNQESSNHQLFMAQTYLELAETRGQQAKVEAANANLLSQAQLANVNRQILGKDSQISEMNNELASKDNALASKDNALASKDNELASKDAELLAAQEQLRGYNMKVTDLGSTMVLQDVSFETGHSNLLAGGVNRLQPLINYLRLSPNTRVRIEGYTDNVGGMNYNMGLSLARANSVKSILTASGISDNRIETIGFGFDKPVASNSTIAGRQLNRRVEITLLKQPGM